MTEQYLELERVLYVRSFNLKEGKAHEFQRFIKENEKSFNECAPKGWAYRRTYFRVLDFGRFAVAMFWELTNYGDFDVWCRHKDETWTKLWKRPLEFELMTHERGEPVLLRDVGDTKPVESVVIKEA